MIEEVVEEGSRGSVAVQTSQPSSNLDHDFQQAEQGLSGLPPGISGQVADALKQAQHAWADAQKHEKKWHELNDQMKQVYKNLAAQKKQWAQQEASWPSDDPALIEEGSRGSIDTQASLPSNVDEDLQQAEEG